MRRIYQRIFALLLVLSCLWASAALADGDRVFDRAELFTASEVQELEQEIQAFQEETGMDFVIVTSNESHKGSAQQIADAFYEQGGFGCTIHGESVLLGTASFLRKQDVRLPSNINLKTGIFLAIDHQLAAVFAVKYEASENVDYALRTLHRSRITPILAVRDPNITPALLKRKFYKKIKVEYPQLTDRVALSEAEEDRGLPRALLLREGLLPYAEAVVGSRRLRTAVRRATWLSLAGSAAGVLLTAYLVSLGKFDLLTPLSLTVYNHTGAVKKEDTFQ